MSKKNKVSNQNNEKEFKIDSRQDLINFNEQNELVNIVKTNTD